MGHNVYVLCALDELWKSQTHLTEDNRTGHETIQRGTKMYVSLCPRLRL